MAEVAWNQKLCVGIQQVDDEHQNLVAVLNQLDEAMRKGKGTRVMSEVLAQLVQYTQIHFDSEEALMLECDYPKLKLHQSQHRQLVEKVVKYQQKFEKSGKRITREMMEFLTYWLTNHILVDDMAFGKYYAGATSGSTTACP
jgi:hemerythrin